MNDITWKGSTPVSTRFDDVYFSAEDGIAETEHVFLKGNNLPERFKKAEAFTIGELGFGTGLNFLVALDHWQKTHQNAENKTLHFISCEKYPLEIPNMEKICADMQYKLPLYVDLLRKWCEIVPDAEIIPIEGWHTLKFMQSGTCSSYLHLFIGDVGDMLKTLPQKVDAWFMDGFSPAQNPAMWQSSIYNAMANQSNPQATLATFTAAGHVRRGLEEAGFCVRKEKGYGHKRDMTVGYLCDKLIARN